MDIDRCLTPFERKQLHTIPMQKPLTNILSSVEDLRTDSVKIDEIQELINAEKAKQYEHFKIQLIGELL